MTTDSRSRGTWRLFGFAGTALFVGMIVWMAFGFGRETSARAPDDVPDVRRGPNQDDESRSSGSIPANAADESRAATEQGLVLLAEDVEHRPVSGARLLAVRRDPTGPGVTLAQIAVTDPAGRAVVSPGPLAQSLERGTEAAALVVEHPAYVTLPVPKPRIRSAAARGQPLRVTMRSGYWQEFTVLTEQGRPYSGPITVRLARVPIMESPSGPEPAQNDREASVLPGDDVREPRAPGPVTSSRTAESLRVHADLRSGGLVNASGLVRIGPLPEGLYYVGVDTPDGVMVVSGVQHGRLRVPSPRVVLKVASLWVAVARVEADRIVSFNARTRDISSGNCGLGQLRAARNALARRWKTPLVAAGRPRGHRKAPPTVEWELLLERTGWRRVTVPFRPWEEFDRPNRIRVPPDAPAIGSGSVTVGFPEEPWKSFPLEARLHVGRRMPPRAAIPIVLGRPTVVPRETYQLFVEDRLLRRLVGEPRFVVRPEEGVTRISLDAPSVLHPCFLTVRRDDGTLATSSSVRVYASGTVDPVWQGNLAHPERVPLCLPKRGLRIVTRSPACRETVTLVDLTQPPRAASELEIVVQWDHQ